jgi:hypothetical protein
MSLTAFGWELHAAHWRAQDTQVPTGYLGSKEGADTLKGHSTTGMGDRGALGESQGGLGTGALLKEHADASKDQVRRGGGMGDEGPVAAAFLVVLPVARGRLARAEALACMLDWRGRHKRRACLSARDVESRVACSVACNTPRVTAAAVPDWQACVATVRAHQHPSCCCAGRQVGGCKWRKVPRQLRGGARGGPAVACGRWHGHQHGWHGHQHGCDEAIVWA